MRYKHNPALVAAARSLRKNMTPQERKLWYQFLRSYPIRILRQKPIGNYIADFYCAGAKLVIEIDGGQHYETDGPLRDAERTADLAKYGLRVIRVNNADVNRNFSGVCEYIDRCIRSALEAQSKPSSTSLV